VSAELELELRRGDVDDRNGIPRFRAAAARAQRHYRGEQRPRTQR